MEKGHVLAINLWLQPETLVFLSFNEPYHRENTCWYLLYLYSIQSRELCCDFPLGLNICRWFLQI